MKSCLPSLSSSISPSLQPWPTCPWLIRVQDISDVDHMLLDFNTWVWQVCVIWWGRRDSESHTKCCVEVLKRHNHAHGEQDIVDSMLFKEQPDQSADTGLYRTSFHLYHSYITSCLSGIENSDLLEKRTLTSPPGLFWLSIRKDSSPSFSRGHDSQQ